MKSKFINKKIDYTGEQLRSHYIFEIFGLEGDAIVSFIGSCDVKEHMVDLADKKNKEFIFSESMLHFLCEHFEGDLEKTIMRKRLLISIILEELHKAINKEPSPPALPPGRRDKLFHKGEGGPIYRDGNGIYAAGKKLTVAVATVSPVSGLIHAGLNISSKNTPVETSCLADYGIKPEKFANIVMKRYCHEMDSIKVSRRKVKGVQ